MRLRLLGTGTSFGVPQVGCQCPVCRSDDPRDRRSRTGALIETGSTTILIDSPPELRLQLVQAGVSQIDAVLYTHEHADHVMGIDDLRVFTVRRRGCLPAWGPPETMACLRHSFRYIFDPAIRVPEGTSKPQIELRPATAGVPFEVAGLPVLPLAVEHGYTPVLGYRVGNLGYLTDVKRLPPETLAALEGVEVLVLGALWWRDHPTHQSIPEAIALAQRLGARRTLLTHLSHETGHQELADQLPPGIEPGYDGLVVEVTA